jgi:lipoate synthase
MLGINYNEIFKQVMNDKNVKSTLADFIVYCFDNCIELEDVMIEKFKNNKQLVQIIDDRITTLANNSETKSRFTKQIREGNQNG